MIIFRIGKRKICYTRAISEKYYNGEKEVSKEEFDKERQRVIAQRIKDAEKEENLIDDKDLDFYLKEL
jgi:predicted DNA binding CopG/RHH family protein